MLDSARHVYGPNRDYHGNFLLVRVSAYNCLLPIAEGEALGLLEALKWIMQHQYSQVIFELDC